LKKWTLEAIFGKTGESWCMENLYKMDINKQLSWVVIMSDRPSGFLYRLSGTGKPAPDISGVGTELAHH